MIFRVKFYPDDTAGGEFPLGEGDKYERSRGKERMRQGEMKWGLLMGRYRMGWLMVTLRVSASPVSGEDSKYTGEMPGLWM